jgi:hypothetical protein
MIAVGLTATLFTVGVVVLAGSRQAYRDPFAPYEAIMPGHSSETLKQYPCVTWTDAATTRPCNIALKEDHFDYVQVDYDDHIITQLAFIVHSGSLRLSDLILCWGWPTSVKPSYPVYEGLGWTEVHWSKQLYAIILADSFDLHLNYFLPIYNIVIADKLPSCRSR